jgi:hypothetical protein
MATNNGIVGFVQGSGVAAGQTNWVQVSTNGNSTFYGTPTFNKIIISPGISFNLGNEPFVYGDGSSIYVRGGPLTLMGASGSSGLIANSAYLGFYSMPQKIGILDSGNMQINSTNVLFSGAVVVTNGIASYAPHTPVAVTVGASPFRYTNNTPVAQECWIDDAAALFSLSKNGVQVRSSLAGSSGQFALMPTNVIIITYPVTAPTFTTNVW